MEQPVWKLVRYRIFMLLVIGNILAYMNRFAINYALLEMTSKSTQSFTNGTCFNSTNVTFITTVTDGKDYNYTEKQQSQIVGAFFYGYTATVGSAGFVTDMYGGRYIVTIGIGLSGLIGMLQPLFVKWGVDWFIVIRFLQGFAQGLTFTSQTSLWGRWAPSNERTVLVGISQMACFAGLLLNNALGGVIAENMGWEYLFYLYGGVATLWAAVWLWYFDDTPQQSKRITGEELDYIEATTMISAERPKLSETPFLAIFTNVGFLALLFAATTGTIQAYVIADYMPKYLLDVHNYDLANAGFASSMPYLFQFITGLVCCLSVDIVVQKQFMSLTWLRKSAGLMALMPSAIVFSLINVVGCNTDTVIAFLSISCAFAGLAGASFSPNYVDIAPKYAGLLHGLCDTFQSAGGFMVPLAVGAIIKGRENDINGWSPVWYGSSALVGAGALVYFAFGTGEQQKSIMQDGERKKSTSTANDKTYTPPIDILDE